MKQANPLVSVNPGLFYIASLFTAPTPWLELYGKYDGVYIEPHPVKGVTLTATNGGSLIHLYDEAGQADRPLILSIKSRDMALLRPKSRASAKRRMTIRATDGETMLADLRHEGEIFETLLATEICGPFPDYHRLIARMKPGPEKPDHFGVDFQRVAAFAAVHNLLANATGAIIEKGGFVVLQPRAIDQFGVSMLVTFHPPGLGFGLLAPTRDTPQDMPAWFIPAPQASAVDAAAPQGEGAPQ